MVSTVAFIVNSAPSTNAPSAAVTSISCSSGSNSGAVASTDASSMTSPAAMTRSDPLSVRYTNCSLATILSDHSIGSCISVPDAVSAIWSGSL